MSRVLLACVVILWCGLSNAAPPPKAPTPQPVPEALVPLKATLRYSGAPPGVLQITFTADEPLTAAQWSAIESLPVKILAASGKGIDNAALARIAKLPLVGLVLQHPSATDEGAAAFSELKELKSLTLIHASKLTGKGAAALANHPSLETAAGDEGFFAQGTAHLNTCKKLKNLRLYHGFITDDTVLPLAGNPTIESINLWPLLRAGISDAALPALASMTGLKDITIGHTVLTYGGLKKLKDLPNLTRLTLTEVALSDDDLARLKADMPKVRIAHTPMTPETRAEWEKFSAQQNKATGSK